MKHILVLSAALLSTVALASTAFAQQTQNLPPLVGATNPAQGGIFPLPDGVKKLVVIDAQNQILAQMRPESGEERQYRLLQVKHVYAGGIAMLFSGSAIIPTAPFVSPGFRQQSGNAQSNFGGQNGFSGQNGFTGGNQQGGQNNGFLFPQGANNGFNGQQGNFRFAPSAGQPLRLQNQPGLGVGTPMGSFFVPSSNN